MKYLKQALTLICISMILNSVAQTNAVSITTGVTFHWEDEQQVLGVYDNDLPATLEGIEINNKEYFSIVVPTDYELTQLGPNGHSSNHIQLNGSLERTTSDPSVIDGDGNYWTDDALDAFKSRNLNHYFESSVNGANICNNFTAIATTSSQKQTLIYSPAIPSNQDGIVAISERNANNCFHIEVFGIPASGGAEQSLGQTFVNPTSTKWGHGGTGSSSNLGTIGSVTAPSGSSDYWLTDRVIDNGGTIGVALFYLNEIAPIGSQITKVQITGSTSDHGDGKFFILQSYAVDDEAKQMWNNSILNGDVAANDPVPSNSSYSLLTGTDYGPYNGTVVFNSDGSYTYTPDLNFSGFDYFQYQVCLPAPNTSVCDIATVKIVIIPDSDDDGVCDLYDLDDDNDGIKDTEENNDCTVTTNNLISNGDFESLTGYSPEASYPEQDFGDAILSFENGVSDWTNAFLTTSEIRGETSASYYNPQSGDYFSAFIGNEGISQNFSTDIGAVYTVEFYYANGSNYDGASSSFIQSGSKGVTVSINGEITEFSATNTEPPSTNISPVSWDEGSVSFTAITTSSTIIFKGNTLGGYSYVDNIRITMTSCVNDNDNDGLPNHLDPDSDGDGCNDTKEAYGDVFIDGDDDGIYGTGVISVDADGLVTDASYSGLLVNNTKDNLEDVCFQTLPIELIVFKAICNEDNALIIWETATETNNDFFELEESYDAENWTLIHTEAAYGNSNTILSYQYIDNKAETLKYYRLSQTDYDGSKTYFDIITLQACSDNNNILVYPNPAQNQLTVIGDNINTIEIFDMTSRKVYSNNDARMSQEINISNLDNGSYILVVNGEKHIKVIVRQ